MYLRQEVTHSAEQILNTPRWSGTDRYYDFAAGIRAGFNWEYYWCDGVSFFGRFGGAALVSKSDHLSTFHDQVLNATFIFPFNEKCRGIGELDTALGISWDRVGCGCCWRLALEYELNKYWCVYNAFDTHVIPLNAGVGNSPHSNLLFHGVSFKVMINF